MDSGNLGFVEHFLKTFEKGFEQSVRLREHSHFRIGGEADYFFIASTIEELVRAVCLAKKHRVPFYILGGGYNLLFDDEGFRGLIIKNCAYGIERMGENGIKSSSGTRIQELLQFCATSGLGGFEFLAGIPGTVGGAVFGNAGAFDQSIGSFLTEALVLDNRGAKARVSRNYFDFNYRRSSLRTNKDLLLHATFSLQKGARKEIENKIAENLAKREKKHPPENVACAGSYFKNPMLGDGRRVPAAYFLEQVGAKELRLGGAAVFSGHANFIINKQDATAKDILSLAHELKKRVKQKFAIDLEEEVIYLPAELSLL